MNEATKTSDRRCADLTVCQEGVTYQTQPPAEPTRPNPAYRFIADRTCGAVATCTASQYIQTPASLDSNVVCAAITQCSLGDLQAFAPTPTSDRQCSPAVLAQLVLTFKEIDVPSFPQDRFRSAVRNVVAANTGGYLLGLSDIVVKNLKQGSTIITYTVRVPETRAEDIRTAAADGPAILNELVGGQPMLFQNVTVSGLVCNGVTQYLKLTGQGALLVEECVAVSTCLATEYALQEPTPVTVRRHASTLQPTAAGLGSVSVSINRLGLCSPLALLL